MSNEKPSIGSLWQEKNTHNVHRVIRIFVDNSSPGTELIEYQNVQHGNGFRFCYFASHWHNDFTLMSGDLPSIGSRWQDNSTKKIYRVISIFDKAESSHGVDVIDYQDTESGEIRVKFCSVARDWHDDFTPMNETPPPPIGSHWHYNKTGDLYRVIRVLKGAKSLHGMELIEYQDTISGEYYVRFDREWYEDFTLFGA